MIRKDLDAFGGAGKFELSGRKGRRANGVLLASVFRLEC